MRLSVVELLAPVLTKLFSLSVLIIWNTDEVSGQECDSVLRGRGIIVSEGFPNEYPNNYDCTWVIDATETQLVNLVFEDFAVETGETCEFDALEVRTATGSQKLCGDRVEKLGGRITGKGRTILKLSSDDSVQDRGFKLRFEVTEDENAQTTTTAAPVTTTRPAGVTCDDEPCMHDGFCEMVEGYVVCLCEEGFEGEFCEINVDDCASNPCENDGTCVDGVNEWSCDCVEGFLGETCAINNDECRSAPCINGGTCVDGINRFECICEAGWSGWDCGTDIDECDPNPCRNYGVCEDHLASFTCVCHPSYTGPTCEIPRSTSTPAPPTPARPADADSEPEREQRPPQSPPPQDSPAPGQSNENAAESPQQENPPAETVREPEPQPPPPNRRPNNSVASNPVENTERNNANGGEAQNNHTGEHSNQEGNDNLGKIIGGVAGAVLLLGAIAGALYYYKTNLLRKIRPETNKPTTEADLIENSKGRDTHLSPTRAETEPLNKEDPSKSTSKNKSKKLRKKKQTLRKQHPDSDSSDSGITSRQTTSTNTDDRKPTPGQRLSANCPITKIPTQNVKYNISELPNSVKDHIATLESRDKAYKDMSNLDSNQNIEHKIDKVSSKQPETPQNQPTEDKPTRLEKRKKKKKIKKPLQLNKLRVPGEPAKAASKEMHTTVVEVFGDSPGAQKQNPQYIEEIPADLPKPVSYDTVVGSHFTMASNETIGESAKPTNLTKRRKRKPVRRINGPRNKAAATEDHFSTKNPLKSSDLSYNTLPSVAFPITQSKFTPKSAPMPDCPNVITFKRNSYEPPSDSRPTTLPVFQTVSNEPAMQLSPTFKFPPQTATTSLRSAPKNPFSSNENTRVYDREFSSFSRHSGADTSQSPRPLASHSLEDDLLESRNPRNHEMSSISRMSSVDEKSAMPMRPRFLTSLPQANDQSPSKPFSLPRPNATAPGTFYFTSNKNK